MALFQFLRALQHQIFAFTLSIWLPKRDTSPIQQLCSRKDLALGLAQMLLLASPPGLGTRLTPSLCFEYPKETVPPGSGKHCNFPTSSWILH